MIWQPIFSQDLRGGRDLLGMPYGVIYGAVQAQQGELLQHVWRRVCLFIQRDGVFVAQTWSDKVTGAYRFERLDAAETYFVIAFDHTGMHRAVAANDLVPEVQA
ncbi:MULTISPECIES: hypothetical protein [Comamonas]|uniref:Uncharacterized protein n=1 Tax=Comamonas jiangduensis TaxID=1194168 RepID=A0ABV4IEP2_9BURK|nr:MULTISPECIES: hypothetical protein [Comamonas]